MYSTQNLSELMFLMLYWTEDSSWSFAVKMKLLVIFTVDTDRQSYLICLIYLNYQIVLLTTASDLE